MGDCKDTNEEGLALPFGTSLVRGEIPINVNLPVGSTFIVNVRSNEGLVTHTWKGTVKRPLDWSFLDHLRVATRTPAGNACNWDTGLTAYSYGEKYGPNTEGRLGRHTVQLDAITPGGRRIRDSQTVYVANVATFAYGGTIKSSDGHVRLMLPEHATEKPFQLISIEPAGTKQKGTAVYRFLTNEPRFLQPVGMKIDNASFKGVSVYLASAADDRKTWRMVRGYWNREGSFRGTVAELPAAESFLVLTKKQVKIMRDHPDHKPPDSPAIKKATAAAKDIILDFEDGVQGVRAKYLRYGTEVIVQDNGPSGRHLCLQNPNRGNLGTSLLRGGLSLRLYPRLSFDIRIEPGADVNLQARIDGKWYEVEMTDKPGTYNRVNMVSIGRVEGLQADARWHHVSIDLRERLETHSPADRHTNLVLQELTLGNFDAASFMKLSRGINPPGVRVMMDNIVLHRNPGNPVPKPVGQGRWPTVLPLLKSVGNRTWAPASCRPAATMTINHNSESITLSYKPGEKDCFGHIGVQPNIKDWRDFDALRFRVKYQRGDERLTLAVKDIHENQSAIRVDAYLEGESPGMKWRTVTIPAAAFSKVDLAAVHQLMFVFDNHTDLRPQQVRVKQLELLAGPMKPDLVLGRFSTGLNAWGVRPWTFNNKGAEIAAISTRFGQVLTVSGVRSERHQETWAGWSVPLPEIDVTGYETLLLRLRRVTGTETANLYLRDGTGESIVPLSEYLDDHTDWQTVRIPLDRLEQKDFDFSNLKELVLAFEWLPLDGILMIDDIRFIKTMLP